MNDVMEAMDKLVRYYRHDFLNILQVAGGLAQLHKTERLLAFIQQASAEVQQFGHFINCGDSRFALIVLESFLQKLTGNYILQVKGKLPLLSPATLQALPEILTAILSCLPKIKDYTVCLYLEGDKQSQMRLSLLEELTVDWQQALLAAARHNLQAVWDQENGEYILLLDKRDSTGEK
jgi:hypothetical protein